MNTLFEKQFNIVQQEVNKNSRNKGFWDNVDLTTEVYGLKLALIHSEISEALEAVRKDFPMSQKIPAGNFGEELADAVIRIMDLAEQSNLDLAEIILLKMNYNAGRSHMHGGKKA